MRKPARRASASASARASWLGKPAEFDQVGDGAVELADALLLAFVVAFEIEAAGFEDQQDTGRGVLQILGERGGIAQSRLAFGIFLGPAARQGGFGVEDPDETLGGEQGEPAGVVEDWTSESSERSCSVTAPSGNSR
jgi:hypothetical protein